MTEEEQFAIQQAALVIIGTLFDKTWLNTGVSQITVPFTPHSTGKEEKFHIVIYKESSGWHEPIQEALKDEGDVPKL